MYCDVSFGAYERKLCQLKLEVRLASSCYVLVVYPNNPLCYCFIALVYAISFFFSPAVRAGGEFWKLETYCYAEMAILMCILMFHLAPMSVYCASLSWKFALRVHVMCWCYTLITLFYCFIAIVYML